MITSRVPRRTSVWSLTPAFRRLSQGRDGADGAKAGGKLAKRLALALRATARRWYRRAEGRPRCMDSVAGCASRSSRSMTASMPGIACTCTLMFFRGVQIAIGRAVLVFNVSNSPDKLPHLAVS
jgi:hypothetical protein